MLHNAPIPLVYVVKNSFSASVGVSPLACLNNISLIFSLITFLVSFFGLAVLALTTLALTFLGGWRINCSVLCILFQGTIISLNSFKVTGSSDRFLELIASLASFILITSSGGNP